MNPVERGIQRIDAVQQRHKASAFVFGVVKKYGDDNGGTLAASLAHSAGRRIARAALGRDRACTGRVVHDGAGVEPAGPGAAGIPAAARALGDILGVLGSVVIVTTLLAGLDTFGHHAIAIVVLAQVLALAATSGCTLSASACCHRRTPEEVAPPAEAQANRCLEFD